jgi:hypothetical protein
MISPDYTGSGRNIRRSCNPSAALLAGMKGLNGDHGIRPRHLSLTLSSDKVKEQNSFLVLD